MLTKEEEKIFESVKPIIDDLRSWASHIRSQEVPSESYDPLNTYREDYYKNKLQSEFVNTGKVKQIWVGFQRDTWTEFAIIVAKFPHIDKKLRFIVRLEGVPNYE